MVAKHLPNGNWVISTKNGPRNILLLPRCRFKRANRNNTLMKKTILPIIFCFAISSITAHAADSGGNEGGMPAKKSFPIIHNILSDKLPSRLQKTIKKDYSSYWITGLYKSQVNGRTSYHITVENADQIIQLSATSSTQWSVNHIVPRETL